jgi:hypothetical protein
VRKLRLDADAPAVFRNRYEHVWCPAAYGCVTPRHLWESRSLGSFLGSRPLRLLWQLTSCQPLECVCPLHHPLVCMISKIKDWGCPAPRSCLADQRKIRLHLCCLLFCLLEWLTSIALRAGVPSWRTCRWWSARSQGSKMMLSDGPPPPFNFPLQVAIALRGLTRSQCWPAQQIACCLECWC